MEGLLVEDRFADLDARVADLVARLQRIRVQERALMRQLRSDQGKSQSESATGLDAVITRLVSQLESTKDSEKELIRRLESVRLKTEQLTAKDRDHWSKHPDVYLG